MANLVNDDGYASWWGRFYRKPAKGQTYHVAHDGSEAADGLTPATARLYLPWDRAVGRGTASWSLLPGDVIECHFPLATPLTLDPLTSAADAGVVVDGSAGVGTERAPIVVRPRAGSDLVLELRHDLRAGHTWTPEPAEGANIWSTSIAGSGTTLFRVIFDFIGYPPADAAANITPSLRWFLSGSKLYVYSIGSPNGYKSLYAVADNGTYKSGIRFDNGAAWIVFEDVTQYGGRYCADFRGAGPVNCGIHGIDHRYSARDGVIFGTGAGSGATSCFVEGNAKKSRITRDWSAAEAAEQAAVSTTGWPARSGGDLVLWLEADWCGVRNLRLFDAGHGALVVGQSTAATITNFRALDIYAEAVNSRYMRLYGGSLNGNGGKMLRLHGRNMNVRSAIGFKNAEVAFIRHENTTNSTVSDIEAAVGAGAQSGQGTLLPYSVSQQCEGCNVHDITIDSAHGLGMRLSASSPLTMPATNKLYNLVMADVGTVALEQDQALYFNEVSGATLNYQDISHVVIDNASGTVNVRGGGGSPTARDHTVRTLAAAKSLPVQDLGANIEEADALLDKGKSFYTGFARRYEEGDSQLDLTGRPVPHGVAAIGALVNMTAEVPEVVVPPEAFNPYAVPDKRCNYLYFNKAAELPWTNQDGRGDVGPALDTRNVDDAQEGTYVEWTVTSAVNEWINGDYQNQGLLMRMGDAGGTDFDSLETVGGNPPQIQFDGGAWTNATWDTYIASSGTTSWDTATKLNCNNSGSARHSPVLYWQDSLLPTSPVSEAKVRVFVKAGGAFSPQPNLATLHAVRTPSLDDNNAVCHGVARSYVNDTGLNGDSAIHWYDDFQLDPHTVGTIWEISGESPSLNEDVVASPSIAGNALRVRVPTGVANGASLRARFTQAGGPGSVNEVYMRIAFRIHPDWDGRLLEGKYFGISGSQPTNSPLHGGNSSIGGFGATGYTWRGLTKKMTESDNVIPSDKLVIGTYAYHVPRVAAPTGDNFAHTFNARCVMNNDSWHWIERYARPNDVDHVTTKRGQRNGITMEWFDGRLAFVKNDWWVRSMGDLPLSHIWIAMYHGGTTPTPTKDLLSYYDNMAVGSQYVGPLVASTPTAPTLTSTIPTQAATNGSPYTKDVSTHFSGANKFLLFGANAGVGLSGLTINTATGVISGTPSVSATGRWYCVVLAIDTVKKTATPSNVFAIDVTHATLSGPAAVGTISDELGWERNVGITTKPVAANFSTDFGTIAYRIDARRHHLKSANGSEYEDMIDGVSINSSNGDITGTPTKAGTYTVVVTAQVERWFAVQTFTAFVNGIKNGTFSSGTFWTAEAGWSITGGQAVATATSNLLYQVYPISTPVGRSIRLKYTCTIDAGSVRPRLSDGASQFEWYTSRATGGTYEETIVLSKTGIIRLAFVGTGFSGTIDNVELEDVTDA